MSVHSTDTNTQIALLVASSISNVREWQSHQEICSREALQRPAPPPLSTRKPTSSTQTPLAAGPPGYHAAHLAQTSHPRAIQGPPKCMSIPSGPLLPTSTCLQNKHSDCSGTPPTTEARGYADQSRQLKSRAVPAPLTKQLQPQHQSYCC